MRIKFRSTWDNNHATYVCMKCKFNAKRAGTCPKCRNEMECIGTRWRIGKHGNFKRYNPIGKPHSPKQKEFVKSQERIFKIKET